MAKAMKRLESLFLVGCVLVFLLIETTYSETTQSTTTGTTQSTTIGTTQSTTTGTTKQNTGTTMQNTGTTMQNTGTTEQNTGTTIRNTGTTKQNTGTTIRNTGTTKQFTTAWNNRTTYSVARIARFLAAPVQLTSGGSLLTVVGSSLDSVVNPQVNVTVVLVQPPTCNRCIRSPDLTQPYSINSYIGNCTYESSGNMTCVLPDLQLPENFTSKLQDDRENDRNYSIAERGSVAILLGPKGSTAYVYLGFNFDGYENVSDPKSGLQLQLKFVPPPVINSSKELIIFYPQREDEIRIKGDYLLEGCSYGVSCAIQLGDGSCDITQVTDNVITCVPPKEKPRQSPDDLFCRPTYSKSLTITIHIGSKSYYYKCLDYRFINLNLILGLSVGLGILALIALYVALLFCNRKRRNRKTPPSDGQVPRPDYVARSRFSFKSQPPQSDLTTVPQNLTQNTAVVNVRMSILRNNKANGYNTQILTDDYLQSQDGGTPETPYVTPQTADVEIQTDYVAEYFPRNNYRRTIYPPVYRKSPNNEYNTTIIGSASGPDNGAGKLPSKQPHIPPNFGNSWEHYDFILSRSNSETDGKETYINYDELNFHS